MQGTKVSDVDVRIEKNETVEPVIAAREGPEVMVLQFHYRAARSNTEITVTVEEAMNLVHRIAFELCKRGGIVGVARKEQAVRDRESWDAEPHIRRAARNGYAPPSAEWKCPLCDRVGDACICEEAGGPITGLDHTDPTAPPSECLACTTGTMAGPILGVLSNGERCDNCGVYPTDAAAAVAAFALGKDGAS